MSDWLTRKLEPEYLSDSGLLFEINRSTLHILGIRLIITKDAEGISYLDVRDDRASPTKKYDSDVFVKCNKKLRNYMASFGHSQMQKRTTRFGWDSQTWFNVEKKKKSKIISSTFWRDRQLDATYMADAGLIFEINRQFLHLVGISMLVSSKGGLILKDSRTAPYATYSKEKLVKGIRKLENFMSNFGKHQMSKRKNALGYTAQNWNTIDRSVYE